jgi:hypothetical protein
MRILLVDAPSLDAIALLPCHTIVQETYMQQRSKNSSVSAAKHTAVLVYNMPA